MTTNRRCLWGGASGFITLALIMTQAAAADAISFQGKTVTMIVPYAAGGGTDLTGRRVAPFLTRYLPGNPAIVVQNVPGASGTRAMNHIVTRTQPDGLAVLMGGGSSVDPVMVRTLNLAFRPDNFPVVGGFGRGGLVLLVNTASQHRLL